MWGDSPLIDNDKDGMDDEWEVLYGLNITSNDSFFDQDNDELTNLEEYEHGTNPLNRDTDGDGMHDYWEVVYGFDPLNASDAEDDPDKDGYTNLQEYNNCTDPLWNPKSQPKYPQPDNNDSKILKFYLIVLLSFIFIIFVIITILIIINKKKKFNKLQL